MPRIAHLARQGLYKMDRDARYGALDPVFEAAVDVRLIGEQWDQLVRPAASLNHCTAKAQDVMQRLPRPRPASALTALAHVLKIRRDLLSATGGSRLPQAAELRRIGLCRHPSDRRPASGSSAWRPRRSGLGSCSPDPPGSTRQRDHPCADRRPRLLGRRGAPAETLILQGAGPRRRPRTWAPDAAGCSGDCDSSRLGRSWILACTCVSSPAAASICSSCHSARSA